MNITNFILIGFAFTLFKKKSVRLPCPTPSRAGMCPWKGLSSCHLTRSCGWSCGQQLGPLPPAYLAPCLLCLVPNSPSVSIKEWEHRHASLQEAPPSPFGSVPNNKRDTSLHWPVHRLLGIIALTTTFSTEIAGCVIWRHVYESNGL